MPNDQIPWLFITESEEQHQVLTWAKQEARQSRLAIDPATFVRLLELEDLFLTLARYRIDVLINKLNQISQRKRHEQLAILKGTDANGYTLLHAAVHFGQLIIVKQLLKMGEEVYKSGPYVRNLFSSQDDEWFKYYGLDARTKTGLHPLTIAYQKSPEVLNYFDKELLWLHMIDYPNEYFMIIEAYHMNDFVMAVRVLRMLHCRYRDTHSQNHMRKFESTLLCDPSNLTAQMRDPGNLTAQILWEYALVHKNDEMLNHLLEWNGEYPYSRAKNEKQFYPLPMVYLNKITANKLLNLDHKKQRNFLGLPSLCEFYHGRSPLHVYFMGNSKIKSVEQTLLMDCEKAALNLLGRLLNSEKMDEKNNSSQSLSEKSLDHYLVLIIASGMNAKSVINWYIRYRVDLGFDKNCKNTTVALLGKAIVGIQQKTTSETYRYLFNMRNQFVINNYFVEKVEIEKLKDYGVFENCKTDLDAYLLQLYFAFECGSPKSLSVLYKINYPNIYNLDYLKKYKSKWFEHIAKKRKEVKNPRGYGYQCNSINLVNPFKPSLGTPLYQEAKYGNLDLVKQLIEKGASLNGKAENADELIKGSWFFNRPQFPMDTPIEIALKHGHPKVVHYLWIKMLESSYDKQGEQGKVASHPLFTFVPVKGPVLEPKETLTYALEKKVDYYREVIKENQKEVIEMLEKDIKKHEAHYEKQCKEEEDFLNDPVRCKEKEQLVDETDELHQIYQSHQRSLIEMSSEIEKLKQTQSSNRLTKDRLDRLQKQVVAVESKMEPIHQQYLQKQQRLEEIARIEQDVISSLFYHTFRKKLELVLQAYLMIGAGHLEFKLSSPKRQIFYFANFVAGAVGHADSVSGFINQLSNYAIQFGVALVKKCPSLITKGAKYITCASGVGSAVGFA